MTRCAKVAQNKGHQLQGCSHEGPSVEQGRWKNQAKNKFTRGTRKGQALGRRQLMRQEGTSETKNRDFKKQLHLWSERTNLRDQQEDHRAGNRETTNREVVELVRLPNAPNRSAVSEEELNV
jgi:hypothetical protein